MKTYRVALTVMVPISAVIEIDAAGQVSAVNKAIKQVCKQRVHDFDGNCVDFNEGDVDIDFVEPV